MKLKTYLSPTMDQALQTIRRELGPDAVIISSLKEDGQVRVTAASDSVPVHNESHTKAPKSYSELETKNTFCHLLSYHQVPLETTDTLISRVCQLETELLTKGVAPVMDTLFNFTPLSFQKPPQHMMVAGPVGVGKTVTLAKIAAEYSLAGYSVEIISADYLKAGAADQIRIYTEALDVPLTLIETPKQLEQKLSAPSDSKKIYLIDTPGVNCLNAAETSALTEFILAAKQAPHLVMPAGIDPYEMQDIAASFKDLGATKLVMTRFDTSKRFGGLLRILEEERLELTALSAGPELGSRIQPATADALLPFLMAYLPGSMTTHPKALETANTNLSSPPQSHSQETAPLPAWVKGIMEAKKA